LQHSYPKWIFYQEVLRKRRALEEINYNLKEIESLLECFEYDIRSLIERIEQNGHDLPLLVIIASEKRALLGDYVEKLAPILRSHGKDVPDSVMKLL
jgi:hypothetical protein